MAKAYVGVIEGWHEEVFTAPRTPTVESHGDRYLLVIGPFRSLRDAQYAAANPGLAPYWSTDVRAPEGWQP